MTERRRGGITGWILLSAACSDASVLGVFRSRLSRKHPGLASCSGLFFLNLLTFISSPADLQATRSVYRLINWRNELLLFMLFKDVFLFMPIFSAAVRSVQSLSELVSAAFELLVKSAPIFSRLVWENLSGPLGGNSELVPGRSADLYLKLQSLQNHLKTPSKGLSFKPVTGFCCIRSSSRTRTLTVTPSGVRIHRSTSIYF